MNHGCTCLGPEYSLNVPLLIDSPEKSKRQPSNWPSMSERRLIMIMKKDQSCHRQPWTAVRG